ncbi:DDE-type integrase/transposase/recombinase [Amycolatopsis japonica]|uniref:DDE-type integrase/transposase/recombinase n=1 Tax=Amycolatopsis japonica TaxID=208439 RepID=UPI003D9ECC66
MYLHAGRITWTHDVAFRSQPAGRPRKVDIRRGIPNTPSPVAAVQDLIHRDFTAEHPGQRFVGDITCLPTFEGWLYLATVIDLRTREVVGHAMADHMRADLACDAIALATARGLIGHDAVFHSDRGVHGQFRVALAKLGRSDNTPEPSDRNHATDTKRAHH